MESEAQHYEFDTSTIQIPRSHKCMQMGSQLICTSCPQRHCLAILPPSHVYYGTDEKGEHIVKKIG